MSTPISQSDFYVAPTVVDPTSDIDAVNRLFAMRRAGSQIVYAVQIFHLDATGAPTGNGDITPFVASDDSAASIRYDSTADVQGSVSLTVSSKEPFTFGSDILHIYSLMRSANYNRINGYIPETFVRFDMGYFIVTTPGKDDLDNQDQRIVTGYGLSYRLQKAMRDSYAFNVGSLAGIAVRSLFRGAGVLGTTANLSTICDFGGDWWDESAGTGKTFTQPMSYPLGGSVTDYLSAINEILKASGQRPIWVQPNGRWMIETQPDITAQPIRWLFAGSADPLVSDDDLKAKVIEMHTTTYNGDVHDVPNQFVFIQNGLDFEPGGDGATDGSSGLYVIDNFNMPPAGQNITGEIRPVIIGLDAMGQADLVTQGNTYYRDTLSAIETINLQIAPWPVLRHYDIFTYVHEALDFSSKRRLQAQGWEYFLFGNPTTIDTNAVGLT